MDYTLTFDPQEIRDYDSPDYRKPVYILHEGRKSKAEKAALAEQELSEIKTRRLELQPTRTLAENIDDLTQGCNRGGKWDSKGKTSFWDGYKEGHGLIRACRVICLREVPARGGGLVGGNCNQLSSCRQQSWDQSK